MTSLDALSISGIRSFSPKTPSVIWFFKPLTLIVGQNGSGKTTIIECLKYACTGSLPPETKKGVSFVHDPKVVGEREVKAQVRLRVKNFNGKPISVTRNLQVTQYQSKQDFKTLDTRLETLDENGKKIGIARRCADINAQIPELMGVSAAVLEYVIFCHQEESNWPLGEPKELKTRFDDIFAASRYTKALEEIKKTKKNYSTELRVIEQQLKTHAAQLDRFKSIEKEIEEKQNEQNKLDEERSNLEAIIHSLNEDKQSKLMILQELEATFTELAKLQAISEEFEKRRQAFDLSQNDFGELTDEELMEREANFEIQMSKDQEEILELENALTQLNASKQQTEEREKELIHLSARSIGIKDQIKDSCVARDRLMVAFVKDFPKAIPDQYKEEVSKRVQATQSTQSNQKNQTNASNSFETSFCNILIEQFQGWKLSMKTYLENYQKQNETQTKELNDKINEMNEKLSQLKGKENVKKEQLEKAKQETTRLPVEIAAKRGALSKVSSLTEEYEALKVERKRAFQDAIQQISKAGNMDLASFNDSHIDHDDQTRYFNAIETHLHQVSDQKRSLESQLEKLRLLLNYCNSSASLNDVIQQSTERLNQLTLKITMFIESTNETIESVNQNLKQNKQNHPILNEIEDQMTINIEKIKDFDTFIDPNRCSEHFDSLCESLKHLKSNLAFITSKESEATNTFQSKQGQSKLIQSNLEKLESTLSKKQEAFLNKLSQIDQIQNFFMNNDTGEMIFKNHKLSPLESSSSSSSLSNFGTQPLLEVIKETLLNQVDSQFNEDSQASIGTESDLKRIPSSLSISSSLKLQNDSLFNQLLSKCKQIHQNNEIKLSVLETSKALYSNFLDDASNGQECPLCGSELHEHSKMTDFQSKIHKKIELLPNEIETQTQINSQSRSMLSSIESLLPLWNDIQKITRDDIPNLKRQLLNTSAIVEQNSTKSNQLKKLLFSTQQISDTFEQLVITFENTSKSLYDSYIDLKTALKSTRADLMKINKPKFDSSFFESQNLAKNFPSLLKYKSIDFDNINTHQLSNVIDDISKMLQETQNQLRTKENIFHASQSTLRSIDQQISKYQDEIISIGGLDNKIVALEQQLSSLSVEIEQLTLQLQSLQEDISLNEKELNGYKYERNRISHDYKTTETKWKETSAKYENSLSQMILAHQQVVDLEEKLSSFDSTSFEDEISEIKSKLASWTFEIEKVVDRISKLKMRSNSEVSSRRALKDHIQYRQALKEMKEIEMKIETAKQSSRGNTKSSLQNDISSIDKQIERQRSLYNQCKGQKNAIMVEISKKKAALDELIRSEGNIEENHKMAYISLHTLTMAASDLDKYHSAVEKALMKYHATKMNDINQILKELWESTYQGNDIDYIKIRADTEESVTTGKVQRNFNYRVVMVKAGTELDMRGRCSAGQKVLASLVIRLALAETFCLNCGILSLDEPTTNLDRANVESLAQSLNRIIELRQKQDNFQLIVITHDVDFVELLGRTSNADYYYKVKKDANQMTTVQKKNLRELKLA